MFLKVYVLYIPSLPSSSGAPGYPRDATAFVIGGRELVPGFGTMTRVVSIALPEGLLEHDLCLSARSRYDFFYRGVGLAADGTQKSPQESTLGRQRPRCED